MGAREVQAEYTKKIVKRIAEVLEKEFGFIYYTTDLQTLTIECEDYPDGARYGSIKFTLHKADWDLDDAVDAYEDRLEKEEKKKENKTSK